MESFRPVESTAQTNGLNMGGADNHADTMLAGYEHLHASTKSLLLLLRYRGNHMKVSDNDMHFTKF